MGVRHWAAAHLAVVVVAAVATALLGVVVVSFVGGCCSRHHSRLSNGVRYGCPVRAVLQRTGVVIGPWGHSSHLWSWPG